MRSGHCITTNQRIPYGKYKNNGSHELELQIPHSLRPEIQAEGLLRGETPRDRENPPVAVRMEENHDSGGRGVPGPCAHAARNPAQVCRVQRGWFPKGEKQPVVVRKVPRTEV